MTTTSTASSAAQVDDDQAPPAAVRQIRRLAGPAALISGSLIGVIAMMGAMLLPAGLIVLGIGLLPTAATPQVGLGLIGLGALAILLGLALDTALRRRARRIGVESQAPGAGDVAPSSIRHPDSRLPTPDPHP